MRRRDQASASLSVLHSAHALCCWLNLVVTHDGLYGDFEMVVGLRPRHLGHARKGVMYEVCVDLVE